MSSVNAVTLENLSKSFASKQAVQNISLEIPAGSFYGIVGPNGAGKTTTLHMISGLLKPDSGTISVFGKNAWADINAIKDEIGVLPESDQVFTSLTGLQLLVYTGMLRGLSRGEATERAHDLLQVMGLTEEKNTLVKSYSSGMTKKVCLATALIHSPKLVILDEPFESVDPASSANIRGVLNDYVQNGGTVIISSHVMMMVEKNVLTCGNY